MTWGDGNNILLNLIQARLRLRLSTSTKQSTKGIIIIIIMIRIFSLFKQNLVNIFIRNYNSITCYCLTVYVAHIFLREICNRRSIIRTSRGVDKKFDISSLRYIECLFLKNRKVIFSDSIMYGHIKRQVLLQST